MRSGASGKSLHTPIRSVGVWPVLPAAQRGETLFLLVPLRVHPHARCYPGLNSWTTAPAEARAVVRRITGASILIAARSRAASSSGRLPTVARNTAQDQLAGP